MTYTFATTTNTIPVFWNSIPASVPAPPPAPKSALEWLREQVDQICQLAKVA